MATYNVPAVGGTHQTFGGSADTLNVPPTGRPQSVEVANRSTANELWVRGDSTTAVAGADGTTWVPAGGYCRVWVRPEATISLIGTSGQSYSVEIVQ